MDVAFFMQGISDASAWWVVKANEYARWNGKTPFVLFQGAYSLLQRDLEREILPMCRHEDELILFHFERLCCHCADKFSCITRNCARTMECPGRRKDSLQR